MQEIEEENFVFFRKFVIFEQNEEIKTVYNGKTHWKNDFHIDKLQI